MLRIDCKIHAPVSLVARLSRQLRGARENRIFINEQLCVDERISSI